MTLEEKTRLFGHYLFCDVKAGRNIMTMQVIDGNTGCINTLSGAKQFVMPVTIEECKLVLKELNTITRKDACRCALLAGLPESLYKSWQVKLNMHDQAVFSPCDADVVNYRNMITFTEDKLSWKQVDYLRAEGYAIDVPEGMYVKYEKTVKA